MAMKADQALLAMARARRGVLSASVVLAGFAAGCDTTAEVPDRDQTDDESSESSAQDEDESDDESEDKPKTGTSEAESELDAASEGDGGRADSGRANSRDGGAASDATGSRPPDVDDLYCQARAVLDEHCTSCHDGEGTSGTPMGLVSYEDLLAADPGEPRKKVYEVVSARAHDEENPMPPRGVLPAAELKALDDWFAAGVPPAEGGNCGPSSDAGPAGGDGGAVIVDGWDPEACDEIYQIRAHGAGGLDEPYMVPPGREVHPQIAIDAPWGDEPVQAIGFKPVTDNGKVLHHWILSGGLAFLDGWAPGDEEQPPLPPDVGIEMPTGRGSMNLDVHYHNLQGTADEPDNSGVDICVLKQANFRPKLATVTMSLNSFGNGGVLAAAGAVDAPATGTCNVTASEPVHLLTAGPHAHQLATHMKFVVTKADGTEIVMHDHPFRFGEQGTYGLTPEVVVDTGDVITTTCSYTNPSNSNVTFGNSTSDEMCFNFALYWPKGALSCGGGLGGLGGLLGL